MALMEGFGKAVNDENRGVARNSLNKYVENVSSPIIAGDRSVLVSCDYIESFLEEVDRLHAEMMEASLNVLEPVRKGECKNCPYLQYCTRNSEKTKEESDD